MRVKIVEVGFDSFNGDIGGIEFESGVSTRELSPLEINRISAAMRVETLDGDQLGMAAVLAANMNTEMSSELETIIVGETSETEKDAVVESQYTKESLAEIADKKGIAGLREIADPLGIKATSIAALIEGILEKRV